MSVVHYVMAAPINRDVGYPMRQLTMLSNGVDRLYEDAAELTEVARDLGWSGEIMIVGWSSDSATAEKHEDGKDKYRVHHWQTSWIIVDLDSDEA